MANLTRAQRHNRNLDRIFSDYHKRQEALPPAHLYGRFLEIAVEKLGITEIKARNLYGNYTVQQWETLLQLGWNTKTN